MGTIAVNDRRTPQFVAAAGQTDFVCDFPAIRDGAQYIGLYAERVRGEETATLTVNVDFQVVNPNANGFTARLNAGAQDGDLLIFYGRLPLYRPRQHLANQAFSSAVAEDDVLWMTAAIQENRRDLTTLLGLADIDFGAGGGGGGAGTWSDLPDKPANLTALAALNGAADQVPYFTGAGSMALTALTATGRSLIGAASLAVAIALTSPLAAKGDLYVYGNSNTRLPVGPTGYILVADSASPHGVKWAAPSAGGGAPDWSDLTSIPAKVTAFAGVAGGANKVAYFTGADAQTVTDLTAFGRSLIGAADAAAVNTLLGGGGGGGGGPFPTMASYGAAQDNATDDKAAFDAFMADSANARAWLHGKSYHSGVQRDLTKPAMGPGAVRVAAGDWSPADFAWLQAKPTTGTGVDLNYYFSGDLSKIEARWRVLGRLTAGGNIRKSPTESYFESVTTPSFEVLTNYSGWSGQTAHLSGAIAAGATQCNVDSAAGITTGDVIGFTDNNVNIIETRTVTVAGNQLSWSGGLTNAYPDKRVVTHGLRTMNPYRYMQVNHFGGGDAYAIVARGVIGYAALASQIHFFETATIGLFGGDIGHVSDGSYSTSEEYNTGDNGFDVAHIDRVSSFMRTNDVGARSVIWAGDFMKSEGTKPIDVFYLMAGKSRVGIDMARCDFTSNGNAAMQMALGHRIYMNASATVGGRGYGQSAYGYGAIYANTPGDMVLESGNDGTSDYMALRFLGAAGVRDGRIRVRPTSVQVNVNFQSGGTVEAAKELVTNGGPTATPTVVFGAGSGTVLYKVGPWLYISTNGGVTGNRIAMVGVDI